MHLPIGISFLWIGVLPLWVFTILMLSCGYKVDAKDLVKEYEITYPFFVSERGEFLSYDIRHLRRKRSASSTTKEPVFFMNITAYNESFHLKLRSNNKLLAPGFKIYHWKRNSTGQLDSESNQGEKVPNNCLYVGREVSDSLKEDSDDSAALTLCDGVQGLIRSAKEDYIIEPLEEVNMKISDDEVVHIRRKHRIYRRSTLNVEKDHFCGAKSFSDDEAFTSGQKSSASPRFRRSVLEPGTHWNLGNRHKRSDNKVNNAKSNWKTPLPPLSDKTVETLVVVDKVMFEKHGDANITTYTLTLFNMVAQMYLLSSLGIKVHIVLVGLILLEGDEPGLKIGHNADNTLNSFCSWQSVLVGANGRQHDHAILLTGTDICSYKDEPCDTLGFAPIEGMCNRARSCTVNEDTGLTTALTVAHEIGHNFGMLHDGENNFCTQHVGKIMSPQLVAKNGVFEWSVCSKSYMMQFLNTPQSACLDDVPQFVAEIHFPTKLPGELYDADVQCKWQFGQKSRFCIYDFGKDSCKSLWCYRGSDRCETKFLPAAEGTSCGSGMWCRGGRCVKFGKSGPKPIHGQWGEWSEWSACSRSCGGGVTSRERECNKPFPQYGGRPCAGVANVSMICNDEECPYGREDDYDTECALFNKRLVHGWYLTWEPYRKMYNVQEPCKLYCTAVAYNYRFTVTHQASDGMKCSGTEEKSVCVRGQCTEVGCDRLVGSNAKNDACGQCNGNNGTCHVVKGYFSEQVTGKSYYPVVVLPTGARHIKVQERVASPNYIALRNLDGDYYLNGENRVAWSGIYSRGDHSTKFLYRRPYNSPESLEIAGPLEEDIVLELLIQGRNTGVMYEYTVQKTKEEIDETTDMTNSLAQRYKWAVKVTGCSEPCAGGEKVIDAICLLDQDREVNDTFCDPYNKPRTGRIPCNEKACPPRWIPGEWKTCTSKCGGGRQSRRVRCREELSDKKSRRLPKKYCEHIPRPARRRKCNIQDCPPSWVTGKWTECSRTCGEGIARRQVDCRIVNVRRTKRLTPGYCEHLEQPNTTMACQAPKPCPSIYQWKITAWSGCSAKCGLGHQKRAILCTRTDKNLTVSMPLDRCKDLVKAKDVILERECKGPPCPEKKEQPQWHTSIWSACSVSCGRGYQRRHVTCVDPKTQRYSSGCDSNAAPERSQHCELQDCHVSQDDHSVHYNVQENRQGRRYEVSAYPVCEDKYKWCHLVLEHRVCHHKVYAENCCETCRRAGHKSIR